MSWKTKVLGGALGYMIGEIFDLVDLPQTPWWEKLRK